MIRAFTFEHVLEHISGKGPILSYLSYQDLARLKRVNSRVKEYADHQFSFMYSRQPPSLAKSLLEIVKNADQEDPQIRQTLAALFQMLSDYYQVKFEKQVIQPSGEDDLDSNSEESETSTPPEEIIVPQESYLEMVDRVEKLFSVERLGEFSKLARLKIAAACCIYNRGEIPKRVWESIGSPVYKASVFVTKKDHFISKLIDFASHNLRVGVVTSSQLLLNLVTSSHLLLNDVDSAIRSLSKVENQLNSDEVVGWDIDDCYDRIVQFYCDKRDFKNAFRFIFNECVKHASEDLSKKTMGAFKEGNAPWAHQMFGRKIFITIVEALRVNGMNVSHIEQFIPDKMKNEVKSKICEACVVRAQQYLERYKKDHKVELLRRSIDIAERIEKGPAREKVFKKISQYHGSEAYEYLSRTIPHIHNLDSICSIYEQYIDAGGYLNMFVVNSIKHIHPKEFLETDLYWSLCYKMLFDFMRAPNQVIKRLMDLKQAVEELKVSCLCPDALNLLAIFLLDKILISEETLSDEEVDQVSELITSLVDGISNDEDREWIKNRHSDFPKYEKALSLVEGNGISWEFIEMSLEVKKQLDL